MTDSVTWLHSKDDFNRAIVADGRVVVDFTAPSWCQPCMKFAPHYDRAADAVEEITFYAVDVDNNPWAMQDLGIRGVPTVKLYEDGKYLRDVKAPQGALPFINDIRS